MPFSKYNKAFGGKKGSAEKAHAAMVKEYGEKKGNEVFYATKNKHLSGGMYEPWTEPKMADPFDALS